MKMKILLFSLLIFTVTAFAQDKGYIGISLGSSTPIGDFASNDPNNNAAGYAKTGLHFDFTFGYKLGKHFGIAALLRGQANATDAQALADQIAQQNPGVSNTVNSTAWSIGGYMVGGYGSFPISEKFSFESKIMFGFLTATSPDITIDLTGPGGSAWVKENSASSSAFAYLLSAGFKYNVGKHFCLLYYFDYLGAKPEFSNVSTTTSSGTSSTGTFSQNFGTINNNIGIGYRFGKKTLSIKDL